MNNTTYTIRKRKDTNKYQVIIRQKEGGICKQVETKSGFIKKSDAKQWGINKVIERREKVFNEYQDMKIKDLKKLYFEDKKDLLKESTFIKLKSMLRKNMLDDKVLSEIKPIEYREFIINNSFIVNMKMKIFFNYLINELNIKIDNPFKHVKYKQKKKKHSIELDDFNNIIKLLNDDIELILLCKIAYYTGLRIGELLGLTRKEIKKDYIDVYKQFNSETETITSTKSENGVRKVPIKPILYNEIMNYLKSQDTININQRIFLKTARYYRYRLNKHLNDTKYKGISFHYFRHSFITRLVQNGLDLKTASYLAGDKLDTIVKTYIHFTNKTYTIAQEFIQNSL